VTATATGPIDVHCLNCGAHQGLAIVSIIIASFAVGIAIIGLAITLREHRVFIQQLRARGGLRR
jgi:hypothetical protein